MGVHIEAQTNEEVNQIKTRELQQRNMRKLDNMIPVVENLENIDLGSIEENTHQIKRMVTNNLEDQTDLDKIAKKIDDIDKTVQEMKKNMNTIKNKNNQIAKELKEINKKLEG